MSEFPPLAPVPPATVRNKLPTDQWEACIDAWITLLEIRVAAPEEISKDLISRDKSVVPFLTSFYLELAASKHPRIDPHGGLKVTALRRLCFLCTRRLLEHSPEVHAELLQWTFLGDLCCCYPFSAAVNRLLSDTWERNEETITSSLDDAKSFVIRLLLLPKADETEIISNMKRLTILASVLPAVGHVLMTGSDFLDTLFEAYRTRKQENLRKALVAVAYVGLASLMKGPKVHMSLLLDQLFNLKVAAKFDPSKPDLEQEPTLLSDLICSTDLLLRIDRQLALSPQKRGGDLASILRSYRALSKSLHDRHPRQKRRKSGVDKGKGRATDEPSHIAEEFHAHKMSLISQIQDLFPDFGPGYIIRLLDFYQDNAETVIANLLDNSIAPELQGLDKSEQLAPPSALPNRDLFPPRPTPPEAPSSPDISIANRRNIFDKDVDLAKLALAEQGVGQNEALGQIRFGRANPDLTADAMLADRSQHAAHKAAVISALEAFDSDDDERDDTYDVADVGGTVDGIAAITDAEADGNSLNRRMEENELLLYQHYKSNPGVFLRDAATRRSQPRALLKRETGMADEALEGWALMLARDPKKIARIEDRLALGSGVGVSGDRGGAGSGLLVQAELPSIPYRKPAVPGDDSEGERTGEGPTSSSARVAGRATARGRGRPGRGTPEKTQTLSHQRKEQHKASRANHNRRNQRAKKLARGGGLPG